MKHLHPIRRSRERGTALVEFVVCFAIFWLPLFMGIFYTGFNLVRAIEVTQVCRDASHMFSSGTDFSKTPQQNLLLSLATGLNMTATGGNGVILLSQITFVGPTDCQAQNLQPNTVHCPNMNQTVFIRRIVIGNASLRSSAFGTPNSSIVDSSGDISAMDYLTDTSARALNFSTLIPLQQSSQFAYVAEMSVTPWWSGVGSTGASARTIF